MNTEVKKIWINALRSGKYKQNQCALKGKEKNEYCVLGVLTKEYLDYYHIPEENFNWKSCQYLSAEVLAWAGIDLENHSVFIDELDLSLSLMNDKENSFDKLADVIEEYL